MSAAAGGKPFVLFPYNEKFLADESPRIQWHSMSHWPTALATVGTLMGFTGLILVGLFSPIWYPEWSFQWDAAAAEGKVAKLETTRRGKHTVHQVTYRYEADGEREGSAAVNRETYERLHEGDVLALQYRRSAPGESRLANPPHARLAFVPLWFPLVMVPLGLVGAVYLWRRRGRALRLASDGARLRGEVVECAGVDRGKKGGYAVTLRYRFATPDTGPLEATEHNCRDDLKAGPLPPSGTRVVVLYLDEKTFQLL
jgi:hypothetical protein